MVIPFLKCGNIDFNLVSKNLVSLRIVVASLAIAIRSSGSCTCHMSLEAIK